MNADDVNTSVSKPAISTAEAVGSNPAPAPPKSNKRKNHRGGRKTKKKQNLSTAQNLLTAAKDVAVTSNVEATIPELAEKQKPMKGKRCRKSAKAPCETTITAPDTMGRRQDDVAIRILKQHCISPTAQDDSTRPCHHSADPSTLEISPSRHVNKDFGARAGTSKAISVVKQESVSRGEGASGDVAIHGRDGLEAGSKGVATVAETSQADGTPLFDVRPMPGKGIGMFTTRPIARGTRILSQSALMLLGKDEGLLDVPLKFAKLSTKEQTTFLELAAAPLEKRNRERSEMLLLQRAFEPEKASDLPMDLQKRLLSIFETNSFATDAGAAVVGIAARMNHSCTPNVHHCWNAATGQLTVHATRDLTAGEEILTCYVNFCFYYEARQKELDRYGFKCDCAACCMETDTGRKSEERRQRLCTLNREIAMKCVTPRNDRFDFERGTLEVVLQMIKILREEGLTGMELTRQYCMAADLSESLGDIEQACEWARKALELTQVCTGTDYVAYWMNKENLQRLVQRRDEAMRPLGARI